MNQNQWKARKVVIVGAGAVGATFAYALAQSGVADEIALIDFNQDLVKGQVLDLAHGLPFFPPLHIHVGSSADYRDASVIVITAGAKQQPGETRLDLLKRNAGIMKNIAREIAVQESEAVVIVTSNPVDILTYTVLQELGWKAGRVIGSGTVLDSARFRYLLGQHCGVDVHNVHAYILGEHGDSEFAAWSMTHLAGNEIDRYCAICRKCNNWQAVREEIVNEVKKSAYHIIDYKGSTYFAIGLALVRIVTAILRNQRSVLTVSTFLEGQYGVRDVCLSIPCIVAQSGVEKIVEGNLREEEMQALSRSASVLRNTLDAMSKEN
ncbi:l-lactate dehydrogenase active site [Lucifera butyrica]|uniref:L-lactate dehydrogenase n=1 Tax=Lucifera butyrica TaxID=1351585 RepID=A0A498R300_9FIRM|nr:L-lactate dehydrogenase [Lucifera butyrica]VBB05150.1 l-lactate dehydrogenase active site [Lucifera butyrica]